MPKPTEKSSRRLMVEGKDDQWTVINLLERHQMPFDIDLDPRMPYVDPVGGVDLVIERIPTGVKTFERLGIVLDADTEPVKGWKSLKNRFNDAGLELPANPSPEGTIIRGGKPGSIVGIWLMPDNSSPGKLEDFIATLVPPSDSCWGHAVTSTDEACRLGAPLAAKDLSKGRIHAWLAWQEQPGIPFGTALTKRVLGHDSPDALRFVAWFKRLFLE